jgi:hypothetical protein
MWRNAFHVEDDLVQFVRDMKHYRGIFNRDGKRLQRSLIERGACVRRLVPLVNAIETFVTARIGSVLQPANWVAIKSTPGCKRQHAHTDYAYDAQLRSLANDPSHMPLSLLVALMDDTFLYVWPDSCDIMQFPERFGEVSPIKLTLNRGDLLLFRADLIHAGSDYDNENVRLHCYLDSPVIRREKNRTFRIHMHADLAVRAVVKDF